MQTNYLNANTAQENTHVELNDKYAIIKHKDNKKDNAMEQNIDTGVSTAPTANNNSGNRFKIATAVACIMAVCGVGFGVYGIVLSTQKDSEASDYKKQIDALNNELSLKDASINTNTVDETKSSSPATNDDPKEYLYIGEWGIKIKIPDGLYIYDYNVKLAETTDLAWYANAPNIAVAGFTRQLTSSPSIPKECYSLVISRTKNQTDGNLASYDGYYYSIGTDVPCYVETGYSQEAVDLGGKQLIKEMFSDTSNYSNI